MLPSLKALNAKGAQNAFYRANSNVFGRDSPFMDSEKTSSLGTPVEAVAQKHSKRLGIHLLGNDTKDPFGFYCEIMAFHQNYLFMFHIHTAS